MKIVVDTNIVFSALLNTNSKIGNLLTRSNPIMKYYSCDYLRLELFKHREKLLKLTKLKDWELEELENLVTQNIIFVNEKLLPSQFIREAIVLLKDIDEADAPFLALADNLNALLWTGDLKLVWGLRSKLKSNLITTSEFELLYNSLI